MPFQLLAKTPAHHGNTSSPSPLWGTQPGLITVPQAGGFPAFLIQENGGKGSPSCGGMAPSRRICGYGKEIVNAVARPVIPARIVWQNRRRPIDRPGACGD